MKKLLFIANLILFCTFAASFLTIFFFTYVKDIEEEIVLNNISYLIDETFDSYVVLLTEEQKKRIKEYINTLVLKDMSAEDEKVRNNNDKLKKMTYKIISISIVVSIITTYLICLYNDYNFTEILMKNLILLSGVGLIEFIFLRLFGANYICANMNYVKGRIATLMYMPSINVENNLPEGVNQEQILDIFIKLSDNLNNNNDKKINGETINKILNVIESQKKTLITTQSI